jgi:ribulose-5-phosphate 4-epimerase/fuculose-1-phosphate aldolase
LGMFDNERTLVLGTALRLVERGLVVGKAGNVSLRVKQSHGTDLVVITPTSRYYDDLTSSDLPVVDLEANLIEGNMAPSSETALHLAIYRARENAGAIIHTHSIHASAMAVAGMGIPAVLEEEVALLGGEVKVAAYGPSGTAELARHAVEALADRRAVILSNHGAVGIGRTLREALDAAELIERAAQVYLLALSTGKVVTLSAEAVARARATYRAL